MRNTVMDPFGMSLSAVSEKKGPDFSPFSNLRQDIEIDDIAVLIYKKNVNGINLRLLCIAIA